MSFTDLYQIIDKGGVVAVLLVDVLALVAAIYGLLKRKWVPGWMYAQAMADKKEALDRATVADEQASKATQAAATALQAATSMQESLKVFGALVMRGNAAT